MPVTKFYLIGSITVPSSWIALIVAFILAYIAIRMKFGKKLSERFGDSIFYLIIIWKLSVIITDFSTVIHEPLAIIYFNGGIIGFSLGLACIAFRTWRDLKKGHIDAIGIAALFVGTVSVQAIFQVMMVVLNQGNLVAKIATVVIFTGLLVFVWIGTRRADRQFVQLPILFIATHIFVATLQPRGLENSSLLVSILIGVFFIMLFTREISIVQEERGNSIE